MRFKGIMIDCSRLMEKHSYYYQLLDFMAEWKLNTLLFHFSDNPGLGVKLPGFTELALKNAFSVREVKDLIKYAAEKNIDIIPEIEVFGHTAYVFQHPKYTHLRVSKGRNVFNAVNPLLPETPKVMKRLIKATAALFDSEYIHLGCDEVNLDELCEKENIDYPEVWANHTNTMIEYAAGLGKIPIIWADHLTLREGAENIVKRIRPGTIPMEWDYHGDVSDKAFKKLKAAGFSEIIAAPSMACCYYRFFAPETALSNLERMARFAAKQKLTGVINTIWCPYRYLQDVLYYPIAYTAELLNSGGKIKRSEFNIKFVKKIFATEFTPALKKFFSNWAKTEINESIAVRIPDQDRPFTEEDWTQLEKVNHHGAAALEAAAAYTPKKNAGIWNAMVISARAAWICSEKYIIERDFPSDTERKKRFNKILKQVRKEVSDEWDRTRFADDVKKTKANPAMYYNKNQSAILLLNTLTYFK